MVKKRGRSSGNTKKDEYVDVNPNNKSEDFIYDEIDDFHKTKDNELLAAGTSYKKNVFYEAEEVLGVASDSDDDDDRTATFEQKLKRLGGFTNRPMSDDSEDEQEVDDVEEDMLGSDVDDEDLEVHEALRIQKNELKYTSMEDYFGFSSLHEQKETKDSQGTDVKPKKVKDVGSDECQKIADELRANLEALNLMLSDNRELSVKQQSKAQLLLTYCMNLNFFLTLRSDGEDAYNHPVIERICHLKKTIDNFDSLFKVSKILKNSDTLDISEMQGAEIDEDDLHRPINKTIIQNRGILPYRKKENKNPRVRHRNKYKKAIKRRKGQVPGLLKNKQYLGEVTGINPGRIRSIKFK